MLCERNKDVPILIDGHNLIGYLTPLSLQEADDEEWLVRVLKSYRARTGKAITVVFDPGGAFHLPRAQRSGGIEIVFAPHGSSADALIARRVARSRNPREWLVVTSDRELAEVVVRQGGRVCSAQEFAAELGSRCDMPSQPKETPPTPQEVEWWLTLFEDRD